MMLLETQHVLRANRVGLPKRLIKVFPVAASELRRQMVNEFRLGTLNGPGDLAILCDVATNVSSSRVLTQVADPDLVTISF